MCDTQSSVGRSGEDKHARSFSNESAVSLLQALVHFDKTVALTFELSDVIEKALAPIRDGAIAVQMIALVENLADFLHLACVSGLFPLAIFLKAERESVENVEEIKSMMKGCEVAAAHIMAACLHSLCETVSPIRFALRFVEAFELPPFIEQLLDALLDQPYRGSMLRELYCLFAGKQGLLDFRQMLALPSRIEVSCAT